MSNKTTTEDVLQHLVGMTVTDSFTDPNNGDVVVEFNHATFGFHCKVVLSPSTMDFGELKGNTVREVDKQEKSLNVRFLSGASIYASWFDSRELEAFSGSIEVNNDGLLFVSEAV
jgi:hypothetical protein